VSKTQKSSAIPSTPGAGPSSSKGKESNKKYPFPPVSTLSHRDRKYLADLSNDNHHKEELQGDLLRYNTDSFKIELSDLDVGETSDTVSTRFTSCQERWAKSTSCADLLEGLNTYIVRFGVPSFENALCIGLGSVSGPNVCDGREGIQRSMYQLAAFMPIIQRLDCKGWTAKTRWVRPRSSLHKIQVSAIWIRSCYSAWASRSWNIQRFGTILEGSRCCGFRAPTTGCSRALRCSTPSSSPLVGYTLWMGRKWFSPFIPAVIRLWLESLSFLSLTMHDSMNAQMA
jgi:hypothetical protein